MNKMFYSDKLNATKLNDISSTARVKFPVSYHTLAHIRNDAIYLETSE